MPTHYEDLDDDLKAALTLELTGPPGAPRNLGDFKRLPQHKFSYMVRAIWTDEGRSVDRDTVKRLRDLMTPILKVSGASPIKLNKDLTTMPLEVPTSAYLDAVKLGSLVDTYDRCYGAFKAACKLLDEAKGAKAYLESLGARSTLRSILSGAKRAIADYIQDILMKHFQDRISLEVRELRIDPAPRAVNNLIERLEYVASTTFSPHGDRGRWWVRRLVNEEIHRQIAADSQGGNERRTK